MANKVARILFHQWEGLCHYQLPQLPAKTSDRPSWKATGRTFIHSSFLCLFEGVSASQTSSVDPKLKHSLQRPAHVDDPDLFGLCADVCCCRSTGGAENLESSVIFRLNPLTAAVLLGQSPDLLVCESPLIAPQKLSMFCFFAQLSPKPNIIQEHLERAPSSDHPPHPPPHPPKPLAQ